MEEGCHLDNKQVPLPLLAVDITGRLPNPLDVEPIMASPLSSCLTFDKINRFFNGLVTKTHTTTSQDFLERTASLKIILDGDACPVKDIIIEEGQGQELSVLIVSSFDHYSLTPYPDHVQSLYVEKGRDAVDFKIVQLAQAQDIVVTQDYGLALILVNKVKYVLHHTGFIYTDKLLDSLI